MGSIKDRNGMDLTEAEDIKKRGIKERPTYTVSPLNAQASHPRIQPTMD